MIRKAGNGCLIEIEVKTGSRKPGILGENKWTGRLQVQLTEDPVRGKANKELLKLLSDSLSAEVRLVQGEKSAKKTIFVDLTEEQLKERLKS